MNLAAVALVPHQPETGAWYRVAGTRWISTAIVTAHTVVTPSRFYDPTSASPQFRTLYLSDNLHVALFEAQALLGAPTRPGGPVPAPKGHWMTLTVSVQLHAVLDLSARASQATLDVTVQELTGDWLGYQARSHLTNVSAPTGTAPTQMLGEAIYRDLRGLEGFLTVSAKVPTNRNLIVFPDRLGPNSFVQYEWTDERGRIRQYRIDHGNPDGRDIP